MLKNIRIYVLLWGTIGTLTIFNIKNEYDAPYVTYTRTLACMNAPLGNSLALVLSYRGASLWLSPHLEPIISCPSLQKHSGWNPPLTRHI